MLLEPSHSFDCLMILGIFNLSEFPKSLIGNVRLSFISRII